MKSCQMGHKIVQLVSTIRAGAGAFAKSASASENALLKAHWKPAAAKGISHGIFAGGVGNYLKSDNGIEADGPQIQPGNGTKAYKPYKARSGRQRNCRPKYIKRKYSMRRY